MKLQYFASSSLVAFVSCSLAFPDDAPTDRYWFKEENPGGAVPSHRATHIARQLPTSTSTGVGYSGCTHGPSSRDCWSDGYSIATDVDDKWPNTGRTVSYDLAITNTTCDPDGHGSRLCLLVNNQYPGPVLHANWGDTLQIKVSNGMQDNGTSLHWHGLRQYKTNIMDGVDGITECPLAPGHSKTYTFQLNQHGTFWYHSHYSAQYGDGIFGAIVVNGPATANYDTDLGSMTVNEWYYQTTFQLAYNVHARLQLLPTGDLPASGPPAADNILVNGTGKDAHGNGQYSRTTVEAGKRYRLRVINTSVDNALRVSLDNHPFQVITADSIPIRPYMASSILVNIGQRYDVVMTTNQTVGSYWFRANVEEACRSYNNGAGRSIFTYAGANVSQPNSTSSQISSCDDEGPLIPRWPTTVPQDTFSAQAQTLEVDVELPGLGKNNGDIIVWAVNMTAMNVDWEFPVLSYVYKGNTSYPDDENLISISNEAKWTYWIIQETPSSTVPIPHPIHLHGHHFFILGTGTGVWSPNNKLQFDNPPRRDSATLPGGGWLVIAFRADNPGAWLMHCHIAWHISDGLGVTFLEGIDSIAPAPADYDPTCRDWTSYYKHAAYLKIDSGL